MPRLKDYSWLVLYLAFVAIVVCFTFPKEVSKQEVKPVVKTVEPTKVESVVQPKKHKVRTSTPKIEPKIEETKIEEPEIVVPVIEAIEHKCPPPIIVNIVQQPTPKVVQAPLQKCEGWETTDEERYLMETNAIAHNMYVGQKLWDKIECERRSNGS